jgi:predicted MFS family arabinose efflux permease
MADVAASKFSRYQLFVVALLAFLQFTIILDFMILSPLGAILMPALQITPKQFGLVVSGYAFAAGASGIFAGGFADRFDRKRLLLFFYAGFLLGTLLCALANSFHFLFAARVVTGIFGGVIGSIVFAIITDLFPMQMRGRVMGVVQTAFVASNVMGLPIGLYFANHWGWHSAFLMIVGVGLLAGAVIVFALKPIRDHLHLPQEKNAIRHLTNTLTNRRYVQGFATTALLATGGFMLMPFGSAFTVNNLGIHVDLLPQLYMITGLCSVFTGPLVGRASDTYGKFQVFAAGTGVTIIMVLTWTHLGKTPLSWVIVVNVLLFAGVTARMVSSQALVSGLPDPAHRGSYMSVSTSIQQLSGGLAAILAGHIVSEDASGKILHFDWLGYVVIAATLVTIVMMARVDRMLKRERLADASLPTPQTAAR